MAGILLVYHCLSLLSAQETNIESAVRDIKRQISSSSDGSFIVFGSNTVQNLDLINWARELSRMLQKTIGEKKTLFGSQRSIRIIVENGDPSAPGKVLGEDGNETNGFRQSLRIFNYDKVDVSSADEAMCRLLLREYVLSCRDRIVGAGGVVSSDGSKAPGPVPPWLYRGIARYMNQEARPDDAETVLWKWRKGQLKTLPELLDSEPDEKGYPYNAGYGMIIAWFHSFPNKDELFSKIFDCLGSGEKMSSGWFVKNLQGVTSASEVDDKWENWLISQLKVIRKPGVATPLAVDQLKELLVIKPDDMGMPVSSNASRRIAFADLPQATTSDVSSLPLVLQNKVAALRLFAVGRGKELGAVVEEFCEFLDAVSRGKKGDKLLKILEKAVKDLKALESEVNSEKSIADSKK